ncbi:MAG: 3-methyl-2-oxobutanoate hydroxymethyltransferase, partial [Gemmatimonadetes bacterium]|nr:3-methyl-2-oxobutanoate hydroxymethyltransferase [Gemmatimonadota bacterium]
MLVGGTEAVDLHRRLAGYGVKGEAWIDWPALMRFKRTFTEPVPGKREATFDEAGIELLLVGDSASNNVYGNETSLPVTVDELLPLTRAVARSVKRAMVVGDLPFGSYQASPEQGYLTAVRFMKEAGAH